MEMARTAYSIQTGDASARAKANELPISPKHAIEIAREVRGMKTKDAIEFLEDVVALKRAVAFRRFNSDVAHKRGLKGWDAGRYPVKASACFITLIKSVEKNAEYIGLDTENLIIDHISANRGRKMRGIFPRAMGRATPKIAESVNIEISVKEA
jgi:large subunit ribosomal protein L22